MSQEFLNQENPNKNKENCQDRDNSNVCFTKIRAMNAVELIDENNFDDDILDLETFDEEGFEASFFGENNVQQRKKTVSAVEIVVDKNFNEDIDEDFENDNLLDLQTFAEPILKYDEEIDNNVKEVKDGKETNNYNQFANEENDIKNFDEDSEENENETFDNSSENTFNGIHTNNVEVNLNGLEDSLDSSDFKEPQLDLVESLADFEEDDEKDETFVNSEIDKNNWKNILSAEAKFKPHFSFDIKLRLADDSVKAYYSQIKNLLLSYGLHARMSEKKENFTKGKAPFVRMAINGKTLKVYLAIDPNTLDKKYYRHQDVGFRKSTELLPTLINARTDLAVKRICELIEIIIKNKEIVLKKRFLPTDYTESLTLSGYTKLSRSGYNYMLTDTFTRKQAHELPEFFAEKFINERKIETREGDLVVHTVTIEELCKNFESHAIVKLDTLIAKGLAGENSNYLRVKASEFIDRPLYIYCDDVTPTAAKMICLTKGQVFRYATNKVDFLHLQLETKEKL